MTTEPNPTLEGSDPDWDARQRDWQRKLGRIRLGAEPVEEQLARFRRATVMITVVPGVIALIFLSLFTAFGRPDVGVVLVLILLFPIVANAWFDDAMLRRRAGRYLREVREYEERRAKGAGT
jgi:hypothetical protein